jgi:MoxR-like ATPase
MKTSFLERLGIYGYMPSHERALHASILTGAPLLLIGTIGEAKSLIAKALARLLLGNRELGQPDPYQKIAADKINIDDLTGYLDIPKMATGEVTFLPSPMAIWNKQFLLIDEISRATPKVQNRLMEIIYERELQGLPTDVRWTLATMNPLNQAGSQPLDPALAGRFAYTLITQSLVKHKSSQRHALLKRAIIQADATLTPALAYWDGTDLENGGLRVDDQIRAEYDAFQTEARQIYRQLADTWSDPIADYVAALAISLTEKSNTDIDTRRCSMITKNIIANLAIETVSSNSALSIDDVTALAHEVLLLSLPWAATGQIKSEKGANAMVDVSTAHKVAADYLKGGNALVYHAITERDPLKKVTLVLDHQAALGPTHSASLISSIYDPIVPRETLLETWTAMAQQFALQLAFTQLALEIDGMSPSLIATVGKNYPIKDPMIKETFTSHLRQVEITTYAEYAQFLTFWSNIYQGGSKIEQAALYFAMCISLNTKDRFSFAEVQQRHAIACTALRQVAQTLRPYRPMKVTINAPSSAGLSSVSSSNSSGTPGTPGLTLNGTSQDPTTASDGSTSGFQSAGHGGAPLSSYAAAG